VCRPGRREEKISRPKDSFSTLGNKKEARADSRSCWEKRRGKVSLSIAEKKGIFLDSRREAKTDVTKKEARAQLSETKAKKALVMGGKK